MRIDLQIQQRGECGWNVTSVSVEGGSGQSVKVAAVGDWSRQSAKNS
jgi:hypothetical protein